MRLANIAVWLMELQLKTQAINAAIVNISGRQRMLSQRASMLSLMLANTQDTSERIRLRNALAEVSLTMEKAHHGLIYGDADLNLPGNPSVMVKEMYFEAPLQVDQQVKHYLAAIRSLLCLPDAALRPGHPCLQTITTLASGHLLEGLDAIVAQCQTESDIEQAVIEAQQRDLYQQSCEAAQRAEVETQRTQATLVELRNTQARLIQTERMSALGQLVAGIAHEINNPINFISGNIKHLRAYTEDMVTLIQAYQAQYPDTPATLEDLVACVDMEFLTEDVNNLLNSTTKGAGRIKDIVLSLRSFSRLDEAELKSTDLHNDLDTVLMLLKHRVTAPDNPSSISLSCDYGELSPIECYPRHLNQTFMHLLSNALDAVEKADAASKEIVIRTQMLNEETVPISIIDNGPGIASDIESRVFDPFFTTKPVGSGVGLGLSVSHQVVVQMHQGKLYFNSEPGQGTEFFIELPVQIKH
ncbi:MAG: ATP-binding protein [Cyanobacteria bacterium J06632_22]